MTHLGSILLLKDARWSRTVELVVSESQVKVLYNGILRKEVGYSRPRHHREWELYDEVEPEEWREER